MVIDSFDNPNEVAKAVKRIAKIKLSKKEIDKVIALLNPQVVHQRILNVLNEVIRG